MSRSAAQWCRPVGVEDRVLAQIAFRQAHRRFFNERLHAIDPEAEVPLYRCECGLIACGMILRMSAEEYTEVRSASRQFAVHGEHLHPDTDRVVDAHAGWLTVVSAGRNVNYRGSREQIVNPAPARIEEHR
jgi:hypothetical protein